MDDPTTMCWPIEGCYLIPKRSGRPDPGIGRRKSGSNSLDVCAPRNFIRITAAASLPPTQDTRMRDHQHRRGPIKTSLAKPIEMDNIRLEPLGELQ
jgi:hypothetical protein